MSHVTVPDDAVEAVSETQMEAKDEEALEAETELQGPLVHVYALGTCVVDDEVGDVQLALTMQLSYV